MSLEADLFSALKGLVANRVYPIEFPQPPALPVWPAIRYTLVSFVPSVSISGDSGDAAAATRIQIDAVATGFASMRALRGQVMAAMQAFAPPAISAGGFHEYDAPTKTYRASLDFLVYASSRAAA